MTTQSLFIWTYIVVFIALLSSCQPENTKRNYRLEPVDSLTLPAQDYTPIRTLCAKYLEKDGNQYLFWVNKPMNHTVYVL